MEKLKYSGGCALALFSNYLNWLCNINLWGYCIVSYRSSHGLAVAKPVDTRLDTPMPPVQFIHTERPLWIIVAINGCSSASEIATPHRSAFVMPQVSSWIVILWNDVLNIMLNGTSMHAYAHITNDHILIKYINIYTVPITQKSWEVLAAKQMSHALPGISVYPFDLLHLFPCCASFWVDPKLSSCKLFNYFFVHTSFLIVSNN